MVSEYDQEKPQSQAADKPMACSITMTGINITNLHVTNFNYPFNRNYNTFINQAAQKHMLVHAFVVYMQQNQIFL